MLYLSLTMFVVGNKRTVPQSFNDINSNNISPSFSTFPIINKMITAVLLLLFALDYVSVCVCV